MSETNSESQPFQVYKVKLTQDDVAAFQSAANSSQCLAIQPDIAEFAFKNSASAVTVLANLKLSTTFQSEVCIGKAKEFVSILSSVNEPEIEVHKNVFFINDLKSSAKFRIGQAERTAIEPWIPKKTRFEMKSPSIADFTVTKEDIANIVKGAKILNHNYVYIESFNNKVRLVSREERIANETTKNKVMGGNEFAIVLTGDVTTEFQVAVKLADFHFIPGDYKVSIHPTEVRVVFVKTDDNATYWVAIQ